MPINPMSRMVGVSTSTSTSTSAKSEDKLEKSPIQSAQGEFTNDTNVDPYAAANDQTIPDSELLSSSELDLESFYLTGEIFYEFKILDKIVVKFKMIDSSGLLELNNFLFSCAQSDRSAKSVMLEHSMRTLAKAMQRYGQTDLSKMTEEQRMEVIQKIPSMVLPLLAKKYAIFEASVEKRINSESIKN